MRIIDADELKKALINAHINMVLTFDISTFNCVMNTIDDAPTIERPQGKWIIENDIYCKCPFCHFRDVKYSNYCPDCGAVLKEK